MNYVGLGKWLGKFFKAVLVVACALGLISGVIYAISKARFARDNAALMKPANKGSNVAYPIPGHEITFRLTTSWTGGDTDFGSMKYILHGTLKGSVPAQEIDGCKLLLVLYDKNGFKIDGFSFDFSDEVGGADVIGIDSNDSRYISRDAYRSFQDGGLWEVKWNCKQSS